MNTGLEIAKERCAARLCMLPVHPRGKRPYCPNGHWTQWQKRIPSAVELEKMFAAPVEEGLDGPGLCTICGEVSDNLETTDLDDPRIKAQFEAKLDAVICHNRKGAPSLLSILLIEDTPKGGAHYPYRCKVIEGNQTLARELGEDGKPRKLIETRGEGGLILVEPTVAFYHDKPGNKVGYTLRQGNWLEVPEITVEEREQIFEIARSFNTFVDDKEVQMGEQLTRPKEFAYECDSVLRNAPYEMILKGWEFAYDIKVDNYVMGYWRRPGKESGGISATTNYKGYDTFYVFSTEAHPFKAGRGYSRFTAFALIHCDGDSAKAGRILRKLYDVAEQKHKYKIYATSPEPNREARRILKAMKEQGKYYMVGPHLSRLETLTGSFQATTLDADKLITETNEFIWWQGHNKKGELVRRRHDDDIIKRVLTLPDKDIPELTRIVEVPVYSKKGEIKFINEGYLPESKVYVRVPKSLRPLLPVPEQPTDEDVKEACWWIDKLFCQFPYKPDELPERKGLCELPCKKDHKHVYPQAHAHSYTLLLEPIVRDMIEGSTPLHLYSSPKAGTGKGLDVECSLSVSFGRIGTLTLPDGKHEDEMRKLLSSQLRAGVPYMCFDDVGGLYSKVLSKVLTTGTGTWKDRVLGSLASLEYPVRQTFTATGINVGYPEPLWRRLCFTRLEYTKDFPASRSGWDKALPSWAHNNRCKLLWAAYVLVNNWIAKGKPKGTVAVGSYQSWSEVIGGILDACGVTGFMSQLIRQSSSEWNVAEDQQFDFLSAVFKVHGTEPWFAKDVVELARDAELIELEQGTLSLSRKKLKWLIDNRIRGFILRKISQAASATGQYRLEKYETEAEGLAKGTNKLFAEIAEGKKHAQQSKTGPGDTSN